MLVNAISKFFTIGSECSQPEERFKARTKFDSIREDGEQCKEINVEQRKHGTIQRRHTQCSWVIKESLHEIQPCDW